MKLSEAMMLGSTTCKMIPGDINSCALGCAGNAIGIKNFDRGQAGRLDLIIRRWPWLEEGDWRGHFYQKIYQLFDSRVCFGSMTLEKLADYVRSIEPDCGECNQFECTCKKESVQDLAGQGLPPALCLL